MFLNEGHDDTFSRRSGSKILLSFITSSIRSSLLSLLLIMHVYLSFLYYWFFISALVVFSVTVCLQYYILLQQLCLLLTIGPTQLDPILIFCLIYKNESETGAGDAATEGRWGLSPSALLALHACMCIFIKISK